ncbi:protein S100-A16 isoform X2 [Myripristis murdjan]|uniref:Protein S100-A16-like n=2 Tax=Myripristis murdjan TaxID=586833 RepID=A0A667YZ03_9TELE|nr:protein S100-A16-like isoform X2 [Myripristis murdjan]
MESAIKSLVTVYLKSSRGKDNLGEKDFQNLVKKQLGNILSDTDSSAAIKEMRKGLDENHDGNISFSEYMSLIGYVANSVSESKCASNAAAS